MRCSDDNLTEIAFHLQRILLDNSSQDKEVKYPNQQTSSLSTASKDLTPTASKNEQQSKVYATDRTSSSFRQPEEEDKFVSHQIQAAHRFTESRLDSPEASSGPIALQ